ncbi:PepSY domain-containing protein [Paenibacillus sp. sptzw28]|uniref:PepSY domain-containing protein n=1 Tax=Paenibacillus sp. sptzw28 TaxID=715179 RepID=UPI001C6E5652|nr:PepSY domain-containing protein [Paenibacillus sp. sptzw28]QYR19443.1 PepSY domain-containing protein [Paenibacillus sp. sptzw28]
MTLKTKIFMLAKGRLVQFDAVNYFRYYKQDFPLRPKLSPEEAAHKLNKMLQISGAPVLEVKDGDLVYAIPVKGIDLVRKIYINAINGDEEGFDYVT